MKVFQRLAHAFKAEGVKCTFGMMGDGNMFWLHEMHELGIKVHEVRHEGAGLGMADGYARTTRDVGIATATCGPGTSQLASAFLTAARAQTPLVAFCGESPVGDQEYHQRLDQSLFAAACETAFVRMHTPDYADEAVRKAFYIARTESRPVMLSVPMDLQQKPWEDDDPYRPSTELLTAGPVEPGADAIRRAADLIAKSKKPVIIVGRGAQWSGAGDAILQLGERIGALICTSLITRTWLSDRTEFHAGISGNYGYKVMHEFGRDTDLVIGIGASLNRHTMEAGYLYSDAKVIQVNAEAQVMMGAVTAANLYVHADAKLGAERLEQELAARKFSNTGYRTAEVKERLKTRFDDPQQFELEPGTVDTREAMKLLDEVVPQDVGVLVGSGAATGMANLVLRRVRPIAQTGSFFGCIGQMFPAAMGSSVATGKPLMLMEGDAGFMMHLAEFETAVRYNMPLLVVVMNNQALGSEYYKLQTRKMKEAYSVIPTPDIGKIGEAMGGRGALCRSLDELRAAAKSWVANPGPMIIDLRISRSVISITHRRKQYGMDV